MSSRVIHWFRQDLRLSDNPALIEACKNNYVLPIYIYDTVSLPAIGSASKWWLHHSLIKLNHSLNGCLRVFQGDTVTALGKLIDQQDIEHLFWNTVYSPEDLDLDSKVIQLLTAKKVGYQNFNGSLLWNPSQILNQENKPYKVFTPFFNRSRDFASDPRQAVPAPELTLINDIEEESNIFDLGLVPNEDRHKNLNDHWEVGENGAAKQLNKFVQEGLHNYKQGRDFPGLNNVSKLSPYLHFGEISPNQVLDSINYQQSSLKVDTDKFVFELGWREFSYYLLHHFPDLPFKNLQGRFDKFPWENNMEYLREWQNGTTGYPIVDAGMRELRDTGYIHNRLRMIVGSFLVKNLLINWHHGRDWFWDCLVDADLASNSAGWQWIAGCGADAAPYFRVFNPILQGKKFDPQGIYTKMYVPELRELPIKYMFDPWEAPKTVLDEAGVRLGDNYPFPIVDLQESRHRALEAFESIKMHT